MLLSVPLALALLMITVKSPLTIVEVLSSATNVVSIFWLFPLIAAETLVTPALTLVSVVVARPFSLVLADAVITVAP